MRRAFAVVLLLAACRVPRPAAEATNFVGPDGTDDWWHIRCRRDNAACLQKAGNVCVYGYDIASAGHQTGHAITGSAIGGGGAAFFTANDEPTFHGELVIRCKLAPLSDAN